MLKILRIFLLQVQTSFARETMYRANFLVMILVDVVWISLEFLLFESIYAQTSTFAGWTKHQVFFFLGVFFSSDALFSAVFQRNFWYFGDLIIKGELDVLLTKPVSAAYLAVTRSINISGFLNLALGIAIVIHYAPLAGFPGGLKWLQFPLWIIFGCLAAFLMRFLSAVAAFWIEKPFALSGIYYKLFTFATKPDIIYPSIIRRLLLTVLPFAFIASIPARAMLQGLTLGEYLSCGIVLTAFALIDYSLWHRGLRRYSSASS